MCVLRKALLTFRASFFQLDPDPDSNRIRIRIRIGDPIGSEKSDVVKSGV
jgi:hypothetical protein